MEAVVKEVKLQWRLWSEANLLMEVVGERCSC